MNGARIATSLAVAGALAACGAARDGAELSRGAAARLPLPAGALGDLCPVADLPREAFASRQRDAERRTRALIAEVRRRPDARVVRRFEDSHTGERLSETLTVRELAEDHLRNPGIEGVPCNRRLMSELRAAVEGEPPGRGARGVRDDPAFLIDDVAKALRLRQRGAIYVSAECAEVQTILTTREEVAVELDTPTRDIEVVAAPDRAVGVTLFRPTAACRRAMARRLRALAARARRP